MEQPFIAICASQGTFGETVGAEKWTAELTIKKRLLSRKELISKFKKQQINTENYVLQVHFKPYNAAGLLGFQV